jgi:hypothetical protein
MNVYSSADSDGMAKALYNIYLSYCFNIEARVFSLAAQVTEKGFVCWEFWEEGFVGIWVPETDEKEIEVECLGMQCTVAMNRATLGAALTLMAINHEIWAVHEAGDDPSYLIKLQDDLQDYVYAEGSGFDAGAVASFLD